VISLSLSLSLSPYTYSHTHSLTHFYACLLSVYEATVGIVQYLSVPLASAGISIFYLSTYETDFTLVRTINP